MLQPVHGFLNVGEGNRILAASVRARLKTLQPILDYSEQSLLADAIHARFGDRAILKMKVERQRGIQFLIARIIRPINAIVVIRAARAWLIEHVDIQRVVQAVHLVAC